MTGHPKADHAEARKAEILRAGYDPEAFFRRLRAARSRVLMLDYDGTLAPFRIDPARAVPYPGVVPLLDAIVEAGHTRVVIVSGRWTRDLVPLLGLKRMPEIWGSHGWERLQPNGVYDTECISRAALEALVNADDWIGDVEMLGARCERKPGGLAFHWRGLANGQVADIRNRVFEKWMELGYRQELSWHDFDGGIELRAAGRNKGDVVKILANEAGSDAVLGYFGDDLTDEDAFRAMSEGGLSVLVRPQFRPTVADVWIRPPEELLEFLRRWHESARQHP
jgi:trehalose-phosphatase